MLLLACEGECCSLMFYTFYSSFVYSTNSNFLHIN